MTVIQFNHSLSSNIATSHHKWVYKAPVIIDSDWERELAEWNINNPEEDLEKANALYQANRNIKKVNIKSHQADEKFRVRLARAYTRLMG